MPLFSYQATDGAGKLVKGTLEAKDKTALVDRLQEMGYFPISVDKSREDTLKGRSGGGLFSRSRRRVTGADIVGFTQELSGMLEAGLPLDRSISILAELERNETFKEVLLDTYKGIQGGDSLADCLEKHSNIFSEIYVNTIRAGEAGGSLETVLVRLKKFMEDIQRIKDDIKSALIYPLLLTFVGGGAVAVMLLFVIPRFSVVLNDMGGAMPLPTVILLGISEALRSYWPVILGLIIFLAVAFKYAIKTKEGRLRLDAFKIKIPLFGPILRKAVVSRFSRTLGALLQGGLPILDALSISVKTMGNASMSRAIGPVIDGVRRGRGLTVPLRESGVFPELAVHMLAVGEETGRLDETLLMLADKYDRDISVAIKRLLSLLEPVIILFMAVIVGFIVISLILAVFSINDLPM